MTIDWTKPIRWMNNTDMTVTVMPGRSIDDQTVIRLGLKYDPNYAKYVLIETETGRAFRGGKVADDKFNRVENVPPPLSLEERVARIEEHCGL